MNPIFFGSTREPLFGVYHAPTARPVREAGVVLCQPAGHEYVRAHRFMLHLAGVLTGRGYHVMRFDYSGTGDSWGDGDDASLARWARDTLAAIDELRDTAGITRVHLLGARLGAAVALQAAAGRVDVDALVLWDPILRGTEHAAALRTVGEAFLAAEYPPPRPDERFDPALHGVVGHPLTAPLRAELDNLDATATRIGGRRLALVLTSEAAGTDAQRIRLADAGRAPRVERVAVATRWSEASHAAVALLPQQLAALTTTLVDCLE